jgi:hypothetical protein
MAGERTFKHIHGRPDAWEGFIVSVVQTKVEPLLLVHLAHSKSSKTDYN